MTASEMPSLSVNSHDGRAVFERVFDGCDVVQVNWSAVGLLDDQVAQRVDARRERVDVDTQLVRALGDGAGRDLQLLALQRGSHAVDGQPARTQASSLTVTWTSCSMPERIAVVPTPGSALNCCWREFSARSSSCVSCGPDSTTVATPWALKSTLVTVGVSASAGSCAANAVDDALDVHGDQVGIRGAGELDADHRHTERRSRGQSVGVDVGQRCDRILDRTRHVGFDGRRVGARIGSVTTACGTLTFGAIATPRLV